MASVSLFLSRPRGSSLMVIAATAEPKAIVVLSSLHNLDYAEAACSRLRSMADIKDITQVLNNASDYDPEDVKVNKQEFDGISECKSVKDPRELGRRLEDSIMDQFAVNTRCGAWRLTSKVTTNLTANLTRWRCKLRSGMTIGG